MKKFTATALLISTLGAGAIYQIAHAETRKANQAHEESIMAFRQGDRIPLGISLGGDLVEASNQPIQYITVKRDFWIRIRDDKFEMSLDGSAYKPLLESITGNLNLGTGSSGEMAVGLQAFLK